MLKIGMGMAESTLYSSVFLDGHVFLATCALPCPVVHVQFFLEPMDLELFVAGIYLEGRDVAMLAFHSDVLPAQERRMWYCGENPREDSSCGPLGCSLLLALVSPYGKPDGLESPSPL